MKKSLVLAAAVAAITTHSPIQHSSMVREQRRSRHFFKDGKDLHQTSSRAIALTGSKNALDKQRERIALREQQETIQALDNAFLQELFPSTIPHDAITG